MKKNRIRLTESQLHRVIKESVKNVLKEDAEYPLSSTNISYDQLIDVALEKWKDIENEIKEGDFVNLLNRDLPNFMKELSNYMSRYDY